MPTMSALQQQNSFEHIQSWSNPMNIYEEEQLEKIFEEITSQLGYLLLGLMLISLKKIISEKDLFAEFLDAKLDCKNSDSPF